MACCTFKPPLMAAANNSNCSKPKSHLKIQSTRNSQAPIQYQLLMIPLERVKLSTRRSLPRPPLFLPQCLFSADSAHHTHDDDDDDDPQNKQSRKKINIEAQEQDKDSVSSHHWRNEDALVKVICLHIVSSLERGTSNRRRTKRYLGYYRRRTSNGFIIEGRRLLTCAHCIEELNTAIVKVEKQGSKVEYQATVIAISNDFDLAMLTVSDDEFWEGLGSVELGDMPSLGDGLTTMGYSESEEGMNTITSRSGFVLDVGMIPFSQGALRLPAFAVYYNSQFGGSGSAIFNENGKCVGMAIDAPESIYQGRVIPGTIIKHFIQDYERNGGFTGAPIFGVKWQKMENHDLRMYMGIQHDQEGVRIIDKDPGCPEFKVLGPNDVILSIDGVKIANDGTVPFGRGRVDLNYLFTQKCTGENVLVKVLRYSKIREFIIELPTAKQFVPGVGQRETS